MTTSLREEIDELLYHEMFEPYGISQTNLIRNGILRILEKRIDSIEKSNLPNDIYLSNLEPNEKTRFLIYRMALRDVKEMLNANNKS